MTCREAIQKAFRLIFRNPLIFFVYLAINLIFVRIYQIFEFYFSLGTYLFPNKIMAIVTIRALIAIPMALIVTSFIIPPLVYFLKDLIKTGKWNLGDFLKIGREYFFRCLGLEVVIGLIICFIILVIVGCVFFLVTLGVGDVLKLVFSIIAGAVGLLVALRIFFLIGIYSFYIMVDENAGIFSSIKKSYRFSNANIKKVSGIFGWYLLYSTGINIAFTLIFSIPVFVLLIVSEGLTAITAKAIQTVTGGVLNIISDLISPYLFIVSVCAYLIYYFSRIQQDVQINEK